jgi:hypothetical protein
VITIAEVIEQCAKACEVGVNADKYPSLTDCAAAIRALAAQYEGCIVAEAKAVAYAAEVDDGVIMNTTIYDAPQIAWREKGWNVISLYRAKEPTK